MQARTLSISVGAPAKRAYEFISNPIHLPSWAMGLCREVRRFGEGWVLDTPQGIVGFRFVESNPYGVLDHYVSIPTLGEIYVPMRVIANGSQSEVMITLCRIPGMSEEQFLRDCALVERDLEKLREVLESQ